MTERTLQPVSQQPKETYEHQYASFGDEWRKAMASKTQDIVDTYLLMFPEPVGYRGCRHFATVIGDSLVLWATAEGYLTLPTSFEATEIERAATHRQLTPDPSAAPSNVSTEAPRGSYL